MVESVELGAVKFVGAGNVAPRVGVGGRRTVTLCVTDVGPLDTPAVGAPELCELALTT